MNLSKDDRVEDFSPVTTSQVYLKVDHVVDFSLAITLQVYLKVDHVENFNLVIALSSLLKRHLSIIFLPLKTHLLKIISLPNDHIMTRIDYSLFITSLRILSRV